MRSATDNSVPDALDEIIADHLAWEQQEYREAVEGIQEGIEDMEAGRIMPAKEALEKLRRA